ncbi:MAG: 2-aminoadipate transaminase [Methanothermococcus sp.]|uniref:aminotransferase-like domain-containing protein n=1 Tax=Methanothermococcus TaxID=155862 RepID=UPI0003653516|nr:MULTISPECIES: PLP-dependent aminotransferase family protein [Methanothermococcus]MDK2789899.1 2-aminoadipate transaminase [Methanothermococcus sp.]MDK2987339.1 2-aminoadipate transaminase [Methanothermococcus sp.]
MTLRYAVRMNEVRTSEIREILELTSNPEIISFAGGLPAPELFPIDEMKKISVKVLDEDGHGALQYCPTRGFLPLREKIAKRMSKFGVDVTADNILITSGSQQGLDFSGKIFLDADDVVICESPSYLGAITAFKAYQCKFVEVPTDNNGMIIEELEKILENTPNAKLIYVIPDFQNPSGRTWSIDRRKKLIELANKYNLPIIEDNPYGDLRYEGEIPPAIKSFDKEGRVVFLGTFSKTFCPGLRIGWVCADKSVLEKYVLVKQAADLQSNSMSQRELNAFMETYDLELHIEKLKKVYKKRRDLMIEAIERYFPQDVKYTYPEGGLFIWVELPEHINARKLLVKSLEKNVAFVPGGPFFPNEGHENTLRLNYSNMPEEKIVEGIKRLGKVLDEELSKN